MAYYPVLSCSVSVRDDHVSLSHYRSRRRSYRRSHRLSHRRSHRRSRRLPERLARFFNIN